MTEIREKSAWHHRPRRAQALARGREPRTFHGSVGGLYRDTLAHASTPLMVAPVR